MQAIVIEDSATQAARLADALTRAGFSVRVERDGLSGLRACLEGKPDVVVSDIVMPGLDGFEVCRRLRADERTRAVPVVLLTSLADPNDVVRALAAGADNFLHKPYDDAQLIARVRRLTDRAVSRDDAPVIEANGERLRIEASRTQIVDVLLASLEAVNARNAELEKSRADLEAALSSAQRAVAVRDEVVAVVSHDLRSPLNALLLAAAVAEANPNDPVHVCARIGTIKRSATTMLRLIEDLLDVTRLDEGRLPLSPTTQSTVALVEDAIASLRPLAEAKRVTLVASVAPGARAVYVDRERALQVFANLLSNAVKFTPAGGTVTVGAEPVRDRMCFFVRDTGAGISAEQLPKVFERFWQARGADRRGSGLGLAIARGIVESHQGEISVESVQGQGTTFRFTMPLAPAPEQSATTA